VGGEPWPHDNPRMAVAPDWHEFVRLWVACRGEAGIAHWPDPGGVGDQAAWIVDAFAALASIDHQMREHDRAIRGTP
jgi:hypothetical protein